MFYKGRLRVAGDQGDGIPVDLSLDDVYVDLRAAEGEELGRWRMDVVEVSRLEGSDFRLQLDGEDMIFRASDPLGFAYNAVTTIEDISSRLRKRRRGLFRRRSEGPQLMRGAEPTVPDEGPRPPTEVSAERIRDLSSLLPPDEPVERPPDDDDFFAEFSVEFEEDVAAVAYSDEASVDASPPSEEPTVESFDPDAVDAAAGPTGPATGDSPDTEEFTPEFMSVEEEVEEQAVPFEPLEAARIEEPAEDVRVEQEQIDALGSHVEPVEALEPTDDIEMARPDEASGDTTPAEPESVRVDAAASAVDPEVIDEEAEPWQPGDEREEADAVPLEGESDVDVVPLEGEAVSVEDVVEGESEVDAIPREDESVSAGAEASGSAMQDTGAADVDADTDAIEAAAPRRDTGRRRRLFGRNRIDPDHEHQYDESRTVGGITRRVCAVCGHVSFQGDDLYEGWK